MTCDRCGHTLAIGEYPFCPHGTGRLTVSSDSIPGGMTIENMDTVPQTFYSKSEYRKALAARGLMQKVEHVGVAGSDKSPVTTRWV